MGTMMMRETSSTGKVNETTTMPPHINLLGGPHLAIPHKIKIKRMVEYYLELCET